MQLTTDGDTFVAVSTYDEREIPKAALGRKVLRKYVRQLGDDLIEEMGQ